MKVFHFWSLKELKISMTSFIFFCTMQSKIKNAVFSSIFLGVNFHGLKKKASRTPRFITNDPVNMMCCYSIYCTSTNIEFLGKMKSTKIGIQWILLKQQFTGGLNGAHVKRAMGIDKLPLEHYWHLWNWSKKKMHLMINITKKSHSVPGSQT